MVVQPRRRFANLRAETQHNAILVGVHAIDTGRQPDQAGRQDRQDDALSPKAPARQHSAELVLAAPQELFEVGRGGAAGWRLTGAPGALAAGPPATAALIAPRHGMSPRPLARRGQCPAVIGEAPPGYNASWRRAPQVIDEVPMIALGFFFERRPRLFETIHRLGSGVPAR